MLQCAAVLTQWSEMMTSSRDLDGAGQECICVGRAKRLGGWLAH